MNPIVDGLKGSYGRQVSFVHIDITTPHGKEQARQFGAMGTPTFMFFDKNGEQVYMIQGEQPRAVLEQALEAIIARQ